MARERGGDMPQDSRFAAMLTDPRFQRFPRKKQTVEIDERFAGTLKVSVSMCWRAAAHPRSRFSPHTLVFSHTAPPFFLSLARHVCRPRLPGRGQGRQARPQGL
jgi:hypothetical protein